MSRGSELLVDDDGTMDIAENEDFILLRVTERGHVTTTKTLDEDEAVDLLRSTADAIEVEGFERQKVARPS